MSYIKQARYMRNKVDIRSSRTRFKAVKRCRNIFNILSWIYSRQNALCLISDNVEKSIQHKISLREWTRLYRSFVLQSFPTSSSHLPASFFIMVIAFHEDGNNLIPAAI